MIPLGIAAVGAVTVVGEDAPATVGSIFTEAQAFKRLPVSRPDGRPLAGAVVPMGDDVKGVDRLVLLAGSAVKEATRGVARGTEIGLVGCTSSDVDVVGTTEQPGAFLARLASEAGITIEQKASRIFRDDNLPTVEALSFAENTLHSSGLPAVCLIGVDSLSTQPRLGRLLRTVSAERFVPGEAAAALLLTRGLGPDSLAIILGIGTCEIAPASRPRLLPHAKYSIAAIERAMSDAGLAGTPITAFLHDFSNTQANDEELTWLQGSPSFPAAPGTCVLSPQASVGETGAASGILSLATLAFLIDRLEIDGNGICLFAPNAGSRGAAVLTPSPKRKPTRK